MFYNFRNCFWKQKKCDQLEMLTFLDWGPKPLWWGSLNLHHLPYRCPTAGVRKIPRLIPGAFQSWNFLLIIHQGLFFWWENSMKRKSQHQNNDVTIVAIHSWGASQVWEHTHARPEKPVKRVFFSKTMRDVRGTVFQKLGCVNFFICLD